MATNIKGGQKGPLHIWSRCASKMSAQKGSFFMPLRGWGIQVILNIIFAEEMDGFGDERAILLLAKNGEKIQVESQFVQNKL